MTRHLTVALAGNPNSGKSTVFNLLTGLKQKIANYPGVTIDKKVGYMRLAPELDATVVDLPGTYSLFPKSQDEAVPFEIITDPKHPEHPDVVVYVADATNLKRNMMLLTQLIDLKLPVVLVLNMWDQAEQQGLEVDEKVLEEELGVKVVKTSARKGKGLDQLRKALTEQVRVSSREFSAFEQETEKMLQEVAVSTGCDTPYLNFIHSHHANMELVGNPKLRETVEELTSKWRQDRGQNRREDVLHRYREIDKILGHALRNKTEEQRERFSSSLDKALIHPVWGYVIFLGILLLIFQAIFSWATWPMDLIESGFAWLSETTAAVMPDGLLQNLVVNGILSGLSGVVVFIPQIVILFFFIAILEETGYLARVSFLLDNLMRRFGMSGKSLLPLMSGTACAIPAIMATRNIESWKDRLITLLVTPLMSCSARLPVYILLIGLVVPKVEVLGFMSLQGLLLMALYLLGFVAALGSAWVLKHVLHRGEKSYFLLELPPYRLPRWKNVFLEAYQKGKAFVLEAGKVILAISIILWVLASFGPPASSPGAEGFIAMPSEVEQLEDSYAGHIGRAMEPVVRPLGYDWKIAIALVTSFAAREVFVGTMATIYGIEQADESKGFSNLKQRMLEEQNNVTGRPVYTLATVFSLLVFYAFAMMCMSTLAVTYRETKTWKWPVVQFFLLTGLAYVSSLIVYQSMA